MKMLASQTPSRAAGLVAVGGFRFPCFVFIGLAVYASGAVPIATPQPPTPLQIATFSSAGTYKILTYDDQTGLLVFQPPSLDTFVQKQTWRDGSATSSTYISLQVRNSSSSTLDTTVYYITRTQANPPQAFDQSQAKFTSANNEPRLFSSKCCSCGSGVAVSTVYWSAPLTLAQGTTTILSVTSPADTSSNAGDLLVLTQTSLPTPIVCATSGLLLYTYPSVQAVTVASANARRKRDSRVGVATRVFIVQGPNKYVVTARQLSNGRYDLQIIRYTGKCPKIDETVFFYQEYASFTVNLAGRLARVPSFTLQHAASGRFLAADVLETLAINVRSGCSGLKLQEPDAFDPGLAEFPDYRFFIKRESSSSAGNLTVLCPLFHRR